MTMLRNVFRMGAALLGLAVLSFSLGAPSAQAAERGGLHLCKISRPNGIVMVVELYGYETDDAKRVQKEAYNEALDDWNWGAREWADLIKIGTYPVPKPIPPEVKVLEDLTGKSDADRAAARDKYRAPLENWTVCAITDSHGNTSARAIRNDYLLRAEIIEMTVYAKVAVQWAETRSKNGDEAAGKEPRKPVLKKIKEGLKSAAEAQDIRRCSACRLSPGAASRCTSRSSGDARSSITTITGMGTENPTIALSTSNCTGSSRP